MKKIFLILTFVTLIIAFGCRKPRLGKYILTIKSDFSGNESMIYLEETKVKQNTIYYGGSNDADGYLHKSKNNVTGEIFVDNPKPALKYTLYLTGKISGDGFLQYKITGNYTSSGNSSGTFIMNRYKQ